MACVLFKGEQAACVLPDAHACHFRALLRHLMCIICTTASYLNMRLRHLQSRMHQLTCVHVHQLALQAVYLKTSNGGSQPLNGMHYHPTGMQHRNVTMPESGSSLEVTVDLLLFAVDVLDNTQNEDIVRGTGVNVTANFEHPGKFTQTHRVE